MRRERLLFVRLVKATRSNKGVVKTTPGPGALFIGSIKVSVNRGPNKAEL